MKKKYKLRNILKSYLQWPIYLIALLVVMDVYLFFTNVDSGYIALAFTGVYVITVVVVYFIKRSSVTEGLVRFAADYGQVQRKLLRELSIPYAVLDTDGKLLWANTEFLEAVGGDIKPRHLITAIFPDITRNTLPRTEEIQELHVKVEELNYRIELKNITVNSFSDDNYWNSPEVNSISNNTLIAMYLYDETEMIRLQQDNWDQRLIIGLLYIDNYEEALESIDEVRRSLLTALVDRKISKYFQSIDAVIKKIEKDKYFLGFQNKYLEQLRSAKFPILDEVRSVNIGNEMSVTISIGLGINAESYTRGYETARAAIDLALGRGGDQVVIKDRENVEYYGGKSVSVEKNTRVKARVKAHALKEFVEAKDKVVIMGHSMPDVDSFGSAVGIYRIAKTLNKKAYIVLSELTSSVRAVVNRFADNPEYDDMIINHIQALDIMDNNTLLVVVDVNRPSYSEYAELIDVAETIVILDHHRQTGEAIDKAVLSYIEPYASSACEMVAEILQYIGDGLKLKSVEADAMYAGIIIDTNNFLTKTGVRTFEAAAYLRRNGADVTRIRKAFRTDIPEYMTKAKAIATTEIYLQSYAFAKCEAREVESPTILGAQVANELMDITNIKASFVFTEYNGKIYISARSIDELNVQVVMEKLGGGGHMSVAGAQFTDITIQEAMDKVKEVLSRMTQEGEI